jgi:zinc/manganese transport system permease protein
VPQEAIIGIIYVVASAAAILVADKAPRGAEAIRDVLVGSILFVTWPTILQKGAVYAVLGVFFYVLRRRFHSISFHPEEAERLGWRVRWWDFWFYLAFGIAITLSVPLAGVLMVFTILVVPSTIAFLYTRDVGKLIAIAWSSGAVASVVGIWLSYVLDIPTGPTIVCVFGGALLVASIIRRMNVAAQSGGSAVGQ